MTQNTANGLVSVSRDSSTITYIINEKNLFFSDGYKALQAYSNESFLKCSKSNINGRIKLTYNISSLSSLKQMLPEMTDSMYLKVITGILNTAIALRDTGFMQHENISLESADIFIDPKTMKTYMLYLPINIHPSANAHIVFENEIRERIVKLANGNKNLVSSFMIEICKDLIAEKASFTSITEKIVKQDMLNATESKGCRTRVIGDTQALENTEEKVETPKNEIKVEARPRIDFSNKSYDKSFKNSSIVEKKESEKPKKKKSSTGKTLVFLLAYTAFLMVSFSVAFNYYKNSGMTSSFVFVLVAIIMVALLSPVIYFSRGNKKTSILNEKLIEEKKDGIGKAVEGFIPPMVLRGVNNSSGQEFFINKKEFLIGKDSQQVEGFIQFDKSVSDLHCKIVWDNGYYIYDLDSEFGTFVNEVNVIPGQKFPLKHKDKIKITKHYFEVLLEK